MIPIADDGLQIAWLVGRLPAVSATFIAKATYAMKPGAPAVAAAEPMPMCGDLHVDDDENRPLRYASDFAPLKAKADLVVVGHAHAPGGRPVTVLRVGVHVGRYSKTLAVIGPRQWKKSFVGAAATEPQPFTRMPISFDHAFGGPESPLNPIGTGLSVESPLPNIEDPANLLTRPSKGPPPSGFGPIPMTWPQRLPKAGTHGKKWLAERWPGPPEDIDWAFYNAAPADQQFPAWFRGDETIRFENLHATVPDYETHLPSVRVRAFLAEPVGSGLQVREAAMNLDTLWVDLDAERLVLVWRGVIELGKEELAEDDSMLVVREPLAEAPRPLDAYRELLMQRLSSPPEPPPEPEPEPPETLAAEPVPPEPPGEPPPPPPARSTEWCKARLAARESFAELDLSRCDLSSLDCRGVDFRGAMLKGAALRSTVLAGANLSGAVLAEADLTRADLSRANLTKADLDRARMPRSNLAEALLEEAILTDAVLVRSNLDGVQASRALFTAANLGGAHLRKAKLIEAVLSNCLLHDADLTEADLTRASLEGACGNRLRALRATLVETRAAKSALLEGNLEAVVAPGSVWQSANLYRCVFKSADLSRAEFEGAYLCQSTLATANLREARMVKADLTGVNLFRANLFRAVLTKATLADADLGSANLFESDLSGAALTGARMEGANLRRALMVSG